MNENCHIVRACVRACVPFERWGKGEEEKKGWLQQELSTLSIYLPIGETVSCLSLQELEKLVDEDSGATCKRIRRPTCFDTRMRQAIYLSFI